jgi:predicted nuclease of predicted toxin-antitoxin system
MRFLANENFPGTAVTALIAAGHDVMWVRNAAPGMSDPDVLAWAARDERTILTFDKDFGELARAVLAWRLAREPTRVRFHDRRNARKRTLIAAYLPGVFL